MAEPFKLMCILAHPDDESLGTGGILARYADEGVETSLVMATRGERGWFGEPEAYPGPERLGEIREAELRAAAGVLGVKELTFLDYVDGELDQADPDEVIAQLVTQLRRVRPDVVVSFGPDGAYGHPDHIAISQFATAAIVAAASPEDWGSHPPHRVSKLYYMVETQELIEFYESVFGHLIMTIDGVDRGINGWPSWAITTRIDSTAYWRQVWEAVACHKSQLVALPHLEGLPDETHERLWSTQGYYRAFSLVNGGRTPETDLFAGLRETGEGTATNHRRVTEL